MKNIFLIFIAFTLVASNLVAAYPNGWSDDVRLTYISAGAGFTIRDFYTNTSGDYCIIFWDWGRDQEKYSMINQTGQTIIDGKAFLRLPTDVPGPISSIYDGSFYSFLHDEQTIYCFGSFKKAEPSSTEVCWLGLDYSGNITRNLSFISDDDARYSLYPMVDFNNEGNIICFWIDSKGSDREARWSEKSLYYAKLTKDGTILTPPKKVVSLNDEESMNPPSIVSYVFDNNHNLYFFWIEKTSTGEYIDSYLIKILSDGTFSSKGKIMEYNNLLLPPTATFDIGADGKIYFIGCGKIDTNPEGIPSYRDFYDYYIFDANLNKIYSKTGTTFYAEGHQWITTQICDSKIKDGTFHVIVESSFENQILELYEIKYYGDSSTGPTFSRLSDLDGSESKQPKLYQYNNELFLLWSDNKHSQNALNNHEIYMKTTGEPSFTNITYPDEQTKNTNTNDTSSKPEKDYSAENKTPGFELILVVCSIAAVLFWKRKII